MNKKNIVHHIDPILRWYQSEVNLVSTKKKKEKKKGGDQRYTQIFFPKIQIPRKSFQNPNTQKRPKISQSQSRSEIYILVIFNDHGQSMLGPHRAQSVPKFACVHPIRPQPVLGRITCNRFCAQVRLNSHSNCPRHQFNHIITFMVFDLPSC